MNILKERLSDMGNMQAKSSKCLTGGLKLKETVMEKMGKQQDSIR